MTNKKITDLVELTTPTTDDVFPLVDIATNSTKKAQLANLPVSTATQTALDAKQATLVSGTNIKTINSTSLLGSGNISIAANPAGTAGQIQFSDGSAFAADSNLFWDNTNKRLGVGTASPTKTLDINGSIRTTSDIYIQGDSKFLYANTGGGSVTVGLYFRPSATALDVYTNASVAATFGTSTRATIKGSGSTSATTSLLVQNSSGTELLKVRDDGFCDIGNGNLGVSNALTYCVSSGGLSVGAYNINASAKLQVDSTTKGFLPPRMTTTQKNAIATPAAGLVVYDTTTNKLCCYNGSTWNDLF